MSHVEFSVDKRSKRRLARRALLERTGGKVGVALSVVLLAAAVLGVVLVLAFDEQGVFDDLGPEVDAIFVGVMFSVGAIICFLCTFVQQNAKVTVRTDECLSLDSGILRYSFRIYNDNVGFSNSTAYSRNEVVIVLAESSVHIDGKAEKVSFTGGVYGFHYADARTEQPKSLSEMETIGRPFQIYDYWDPSLAEALRSSNPFR